MPDTNENPAEWLNKIIDQDPNTFEDAYWKDRPSASKCIPLIVNLLEKIVDPYTRGKLIELLGECEDKSVLPILKKELEHPNSTVRKWAQGSIEALNSNTKWQQYPKYI